MRRAILGTLALTFLAGCWSRGGGEAFVDPGYGDLRIRTIAVMPIFNQTQAQMAPDALMTTVIHQLRHQKKYDVLPPGKVRAVLNAGGGGSAFAGIVNAMAAGREVPASHWGQIARALEVDGLFIETVTSFHEVPEQGPAMGAQGGIYYQTYDVSVVGVEAELYSTAAGGPVWRNTTFERAYRDGHRPGPNFPGVVALATQQLLRTFPENTWAPVTPAATPVPSPVTSIAPLPWPADPLERP